MTDRILVIGYGDTGRSAVNSVLASQPDARLTVLDTNFLAVTEASANGAIAVVGDGRDRCSLHEAAADVADRVIIAVPDDLNAFLITRALRPINADTSIVVVLREPENNTIFTSNGIATVHMRHPDGRQT